MPQTIIYVRSLRVTPVTYHYAKPVVLKNVWYTTDINSINRNDIYRRVQNFYGGKFDVFDAFQLDRQNLTR